MRTTLTLDDDVAAQVETLRDERSLTFKDAVNQVLRSGLEHMDDPDPQPFHTRTARLRPRLANVDDVAEVLDLAEGDDRR